MTPSLTTVTFSTLVILLAAIIAAHAEDTTPNAALGAKIFAQTCDHCHEAPDPASRDGRSWKAIALHMRTFADLSQDDQRHVLAFLRTFNTATTPKKPGVPAARAVTP